MEEKDWSIVVLLVVIAMGLVTIWVIGDVKWVLRNEIAGLRKQIEISTERLLMDDSTATYLVPSTSIRYMKAGAVLIPVDINGEGIERNLNFHEIRYDSTVNHAIGRSGDFVYILDSFGRKISDGFESFFLKDGKLWGLYSGHETLVKLRD